MNITISTPHNTILVSGDLTKGQEGDYNTQDIPDSFEVDNAYVEGEDIKLDLAAIENFINFRIEAELTANEEEYILFLDKVIYDVEFYKGGELFKEQYEVEDYDDLNDRIEANNGGLITITKVNIKL